MRRSAWAGLALGALLLTGGCNDDDRRRPRIGSDEPPPVGAVELTWSIDGSQDPASCEAIGATAFEALISDQGYVVRGLEVPCSSFNTATELYVDDFVVRTRLIDERDLSVSRRVVLDRFLVLEGQLTTIHIDFPSERVAQPGGGADAGAGPRDAGTGEDPIFDAGMPNEEEPVEPDAGVAADAGDAGAP